jgi:hypothetical protein
LKIKRQHYVPRFYLRNFGDPLYCYDKTNDRIFQKGIENIAFESEFYGPATQKDGSFESALGQLESQYSIALSETIKLEDAIKLSVERRLDLAGFITLQYLRSKEARARVADMGNSFLNEIAKIEGLKIRYTQEHDMAMHLRSFKNFPYFHAIVSQMKMIIIKNKTNMSFCTSDSPVALWNEIDQFPFGNLGLACRGIEIHVPLSPNLALIACDPTTFSSLPDIMEENNPERVIRENWYQIQWSYRYVYSNNKLFPLAKKMLKKNPDSRDPERKRMTVGTGTSNISKNTVHKNVKNNTHTQTLDLWLSNEQLREIEEFMKEHDKNKDDVSNG